MWKPSKNRGGAEARNLIFFKIKTPHLCASAVKFYECLPDYCVFGIARTKASILSLSN